MTEGGALGLIEAGSLARGLAALDQSTKAAPVTVLWTRTIEPGRYLYLLGGAVDAVRAALLAGRRALGGALEGELFLANPHPAVERAVRGDARAAATRGAEAAAVGLVECSTVSAALLAADAAAKDAHVEVLWVRLAGGMGGKGLVAFVGESADVESALYAAAASAEEARAQVRTEAIDGPSPDLLRALAGDEGTR